MLSLLTSKHIDVEIQATPYQANGEWPHVIVRLNDLEIHNNKSHSIHVISSGYGDTVKLEIELANKLDRHTKLDHQGNIVENQHVTIDSVVINGVDLVRTRLIHRVGCYTMNLTENKKQYFETVGISTAPTTSLSMYENGTWTMNFQQPVLSYLSALQAQIEPWEQGNWQHLSMEIYKHIEICKELENQSKAADQDNY